MTPELVAAADDEVVLLVDFVVVVDVVDALDEVEVVEPFADEEDAPVQVPYASWHPVPQ